MDNTFLDNYRLLARYNAWFKTRLFDACATLDDVARKQDRGAFFGSIHHTLNHLVVADQVWLQRLCQCGADHGVVCASLGGAVLGGGVVQLSSPRPGSCDASQVAAQALRLGATVDQFLHSVAA